MIEMALAGIGMGLMSKLTAPKAPSIRGPRPFDFDKATLESMRTRREQQDPQLRKIMEQNYKTALSLSRGDIPEEVQRTIRRTMAESASTRGLSAAQATRLTSRALGTTQMQLMKAGEEMTKTLTAIRDNEWALASDSAMSQANRMFEAYAIGVKNKVAAWQQKSKEHASFWELAGKGVFAGLSSQRPKKYGDIDFRVTDSGGTYGPVDFRVR